MTVDPRFSLPEGTGSSFQTYQAAAPFAPLLKAPNVSAAQQMELVYGQHVHLYDERDGWGLCRVVSLIEGSHRPTYVGWVALDTLEPGTKPATHRINVLSAPVFSKPDLKSPIVQSLPLGSQFSVEDKTEAYLCLGQHQWVNVRHSRALSNPYNDFVDVARHYLGQPYVWGGNGARGIDCSGLIQMSLAVCGVDSPRDADQQELSLGKDLNFDPNEGRLPYLNRGDMLFWPGHVGVLSTPDLLLHANATHMLCVEEPLQPALDRMAQSGIHLRSIRRL